MSNVSEASNEAVRKPWYKRTWVIVFIILFFVFIYMFSVVAFYVYDVLKTDYMNDLNSPEISEEEAIRVVEGSGNNYWTGASEPMITIVQFSDFACPYCKESFPNIREISNIYKDEVKLIFRDFPVIAEQSESLAMAGRCAGEQGLFWIMHDKLFLSQGISERQEILSLAAQIGLDLERFIECFDTNKYAQAVIEDYEDAYSLGITGTPTWFINGLRLEGNVPYDVFIEIIEAILQDEQTAKE